MQTLGLMFLLVFFVISAVMFDDFLSFLKTMMLFGDFMTKIQEFEMEKAINKGKKAIFMEFFERMTFRYNNLLGLLLYPFFKKQDICVISIKIHIFLLFFTIDAYFSLIVLVFSLNGGDFALGIAVCSILICFFMVFIIGYSDFSLSSSREDNGRKIESVAESYKEIREKKAQEIISGKFPRTVLLAIFMLTFLAVFFIIAFYLILYELESISEAFFAFLLCVLLDFLCFRMLFVLIFCLICVFYPKTLNICQRILENDRIMKKNWESFLTSLKQEIENQGNSDESSRIPMLENSTNHIKNPRNSLNLENGHRLDNSTFVISYQEKPLENEENLPERSTSEKELLRKNSEKEKFFENLVAGISNENLRQCLREIFEKEGISNFGREEVLEERYPKIEGGDEYEEMVFFEGNFVKKGSLKSGQKSQERNEKIHNCIENPMKNDENLSVDENNGKNYNSFPHGNQDFAKFAKEFSLKTPLFSVVESCSPIKYGNHVFFPNIANIKNLRIQPNSDVFSSQDPSEILNKMISKDSEDYLPKILDLIKKGLFSEIFGSITDKFLAQNLKKLLKNSEIAMIQKLRENYRIGRQETEEFRLKPLHKKSDFEGIFLRKGWFLSNEKLREAYEKSGKKKENGDFNDSLKNQKNEDLKENIKKMENFADDFNPEKSKKNDGLKNYIYFPTTLDPNLRTNRATEKASKQNESLLRKIKRQMKEITPKKDKKQAKSREKSTKNKSNQKSNDKSNEKIDGKSQKSNENLTEASPLTSKQFINATCVNHEGKMLANPPNSGHKSANLRKNRYKKPEDRKSNGSVNPLANKEGDILQNNGKLVNNFFDSPMSDPRLNRFKSPNLKTGRKKPNLSVNTQKLEKLSKENTPNSAKTPDLVREFGIDEAKKKALLEKYRIEKESLLLYGNSPYLVYLPDEMNLSAKDEYERTLHGKKLKSIEKEQMSKMKRKMNEISSSYI